MQWSNPCFSQSKHTKYKQPRVTLDTSWWPALEPNKWAPSTQQWVDNSLLKDLQQFGNLTNPQISFTRVHSYHTAKYRNMGYHNKTTSLLITFLKLLITLHKLHAGVQNKRELSQRTCSTNWGEESEQGPGETKVRSPFHSDIQITSTFFLFFFFLFFPFFPFFLFTFFTNTMRHLIHLLRAKKEDEQFTTSTVYNDVFGKPGNGAPRWIS